MECLHLQGEIRGVALAPGGISLQPDRDPLAAASCLQVLLVSRRPACRKHRAVPVSDEADVDVRSRHAVDIRALCVLVAAAEVLEHDHREPCITDGARDRPSQLAELTHLAR
jgi:hypothetical protein